MFLNLLLILGIALPAVAGKMTGDKQHSLLSVVQPTYLADENTRLKAFSEALLHNSDKDFASISRKLGPSLKAMQHSRYIQLFKEDDEEISALLINSPDFDTFINRARMLRNFINPTTFNIALKVAALLRKDTTELWYPPLWQVNSRSFFTEEAIMHASVEHTRASMENIEYSTGTSADPEHSLAWFREDIKLNEMHAKIGSVHVLRGLVDLSHVFGQILARYDAERFAVGLPRVTEIPWLVSGPKWRVSEGYDPHLSINLGERRFAARPANMEIRDDMRDPENPKTDEMFTYLAQKIQDDIVSGFIRKENGEKEPMTKEILDDVLMGNYESNKRLYTEQGLHDMGHQILAAIADPNLHYYQDIGVMGTPETTMRDPLFYRYHRFIHNFYDMYNTLLPAYSESDFEFSGVRVENVKVKSSSKSQEGILETFMERAEEHILYDPSVGISNRQDERSPLKIPYERLNHDAFEYFIKIHNSNPSSVKTVVRIFIAPHNDETKTRFRSLNAQRKFFIEMDKFVTILNKGNNLIKRSSVLSSVSFPSVDSFGMWREFVQNHGLRHDRLTGCGFPDTLLLPRGTAEGMDFDLFVMLTDWTKDRKENADPDMIPNFDFGSSLCGIKGASYPDKRSRSFPFDRKFEYHSVLEDLAEKYENVFVNNLKIVHKNKI